MKITNKFTPKNFLGYGMITFLGSSILMADSIDGLKETHISDVDPSVTSFTEDVRAAKAIGEVTALIAEASVADEASEKVDGQSGRAEWRHRFSIHDGKGNCDGWRI